MLRSSERIDEDIPLRNQGIIESAHAAFRRNTFFLNGEAADHIAKNLVAENGKESVPIGFDAEFAYFLGEDAQVLSHTRHASQLEPRKECPGAPIPSNNAMIVVEHLELCQ